VEIMKATGKDRRGALLTEVHKDYVEKGYVKRQSKAPTQLHQLHLKM